MTAQPGFALAALSSLSLAGSGFARTPPVPPAQHGEGFDAAFDASTLWYDAVRLGSRIHLVCPKLLNLRPLLNDASLALDGRRLRLRRLVRFRRHDIALLDAPAGGDRLTLRAGRWEGASGVSPDQTDLFAGLNASVHISRNNDPRWIADWARFHVSAHGLQAMLLIDNGSDAYPPEAILEALAPTGLARAVVLSAPQPYGPPRAKGRPGIAKFLQPAMLNLARLRFLARARAVLNADIDELVWYRRGSIFDAAVASALGYVSFDGRWRLPASEAQPPFRHADHTRPRAGAKTCPTKYCLVPSGPIGRLSWDVHRPDWALLPSRRLLRDAGYWHCQAITTNWKGHDRLRARPALPEDPETAAALARHLPRG
jgi:hypothetical protein